jgi:hypothetical protein
MSFNQFMFLAGFAQKTVKEDLNIKRDRGIISWLLRRNVLKDTTSRQGTRSYHVGWPHPQATRPTTVGNAHELLVSSSTAS